MSWWKRLLIVFGTLGLWMLGLILVGGWGYASEYFWSSGSAMAVGFAVAPFWRRRASTWYWPSVALLILLNVALLYVERAYIAKPDLPSKAVVEVLLVVDCMACWALMVGVAYLFERKFPWEE
jgi:hypothetical protein